MDDNEQKRLDFLAQAKREQEIERDADVAKLSAALKDLICEATGRTPGEITGIEETIALVLLNVEKRAAIRSRWP